MGRFVFSHIVVREQSNSIKYQGIFKYDPEMFDMFAILKFWNFAVNFMLRQTNFIDPLSIKQTKFNLKDLPDKPRAKKGNIGMNFWVTLDYFQYLPTSRRHANPFICIVDMEMEK